MTRTKNTVYVSIVMSTEERDALAAAVKAAGVSRNSWLRDLIRREVDSVLP